MTHRHLKAQPGVAILAACHRALRHSKRPIDRPESRWRNSLFLQCIRESLTMISPLIDRQKPPAGVHVDRNLSGQRICAHFPKFWDFGPLGGREENMIPGGV